MANEPALADHLLTTPLMRKFGFAQEPDGSRFRRNVARRLESYTYFAEGQWTGRIKIGRSVEPFRRVRELWLSRNGEEAKILVTLRGGYFETFYHREFAKHLYGNEWFNPHPDIYDEIIRLQDLGQ